MGGLSGALKQIAAQHPNFNFDGLLPKQSDCLPWAQKVDVLINLRPRAMGLENTFPSKVFEYAMAGKAIVSSRTGGADEVIGPEGFYIENENFEESLRQKLQEIAGMDRTELQRRGTAIRNRIHTEYNWDAQARRMIDFLQATVASSRKR